MLSFRHQLFDFMVGKTSIIAAFAITVSISLSRAQTFTYTFESPQFVLNQTTPLLSKSPDVGPPTFQASFTSSPGANAFKVTGPIFPSPFSGQSLINPGPAPNTLTISLNTAIQDVQLDFALLAPGRLELHSSGGNISALTTTTQQGSLTFHAGSPITQFDLSGFLNSNQGSAFAIDNLSMTIPEPGAWALLLIASGLWMKKRWLGRSWNAAVPCGSQPASSERGFSITRIPRPKDSLTFVRC
jgi:hypothetical protein